MVKVFKKFFFILITFSLLFFPIWSLSFFGKNNRSFVDKVNHSGYISQIDDDQMELTEILFFPDEVAALPESMDEKIFYKGFEEDILEKYKREFGYVGVYQSIGESTFITEFDAFEYSFGLSTSVKEETEKKKKFALFMWRRFAELYLDMYLRTNKNFRFVYKVKQAVSNVGLSAGKKDYKFKVRYALASNELKFTIKNPQKIGNYLIFDFDSSKILPRSLQDVIVHLGIPIDKKYEAQFFYAIKTEHLIFIVRNEFSDSRYLSLNIENKFEKKKEYTVTLGLSMLY